MTICFAVSRSWDTWFLKCFIQFSNFLPNTLSQARLSFSYFLTKAVMFKGLRASFYANIFPIYWQLLTLKKKVIMLSRAGLPVLTLEAFQSPSKFISSCSNRVHYQHVQVSHKASYYQVICTILIIILYIVLCLSSSLQRALQKGWQALPLYLKAKRVEVGVPSQ